METYTKSRQMTRTLTITALVIAFRLVLEMLPSIKMGNLASIGLGFIGAALAGALLGPWRAAMVGVVVDIIGFFLAGSGGVFFPGYTLTAAVGGLLYGYMLYQKPFSWKRIILTVLLVTLICNLGLNSLWVKMMTGKAFAAFMGLRLAKNLVSFPLNSLILGLLLGNPTVKYLLEKMRI